VSNAEPQADAFLREQAWWRWLCEGFLHRVFRQTSVHAEERIAQTRSDRRARWAQLFYTLLGDPTLLKESSKAI
jgi:hypothetical protein